MNGKKETFCFQNNAFDLIRYWAAISVMIGHFMWKLQTYSPTDSGIAKVMTRVSAFFPGVVVLFALSGFLISLHLKDQKTEKFFLLKEFCVCIRNCGYVRSLT